MDRPFSRQSPSPDNSVFSPKEAPGAISKSAMKLTLPHGCREQCRRFERDGTIRAADLAIPRSGSSHRRRDDRVCRSPAPVWWPPFHRCVSSVHHLQHRQASDGTAPTISRATARLGRRLRSRAFRRHGNFAHSGVGCRASRRCSVAALDLGRRCACVHRQRSLDHRRPHPCPNRFSGLASFHASPLNVRFAGGGARDGDFHRSENDAILG
jgi:hypothetical protein